MCFFPFFGAASSGLGVPAASKWLLLSAAEAQGQFLGIFPNYTQRESQGGQGEIFCLKLLGEKWKKLEY